ncbi:MAG: family 1 glycosylhydrolase, partial [Chitinophagaceae bacterium]
MATKFPYYSPEVWGGIECTINRVNDEYKDQLEKAGHYTRPGDIERIASLGIRKLRYPILWERHQKTIDQKIDWRWTNKQLDCIRKNKMVPIAGLLHHGSGPAFTDLTDEHFPEKFAAYASQVARQFPWLVYYTPVNEPLTTSRFSGLYGFWYPHEKNELSFFTILLNQLKGTVLAMQAIRNINPVAQLIQTEDLAKVHSTPLLTYQAHFENERRWLTNDFLCGKVDSKHFFWDYLIALGIPVSMLEFFQENTCPPSVIGYNYYVTSERWLDENIKAYAPCTHGTNGRHVYADTEAVRMGKQQGLATLLEEAWDRYTIPIAITECHLSCTREEQMRWFKETWETCLSLTKREIPVKAVTAGSLLGAFDWNCLLTTDNQYYESGIFDISNNQLRATSLKKMIASLATQEYFDHPRLGQKGWWHNINDTSTLPWSIQPNSKKMSPLLIIGKTGTLGTAFQKICEHRSIPCIAIGREQVNILDEQSILAAFEQYKPWAVINATGYVNVDEAERDAATCFAINVTAPSLMASLCRKSEIRFMSFSSDLVFDGNKNIPYHENDKVLPLNVYGCTKAEAEKSILSLNPTALVIRTSAFLGPWDNYNFASSVISALTDNQPFSMASDVMISPTYVPDLCNTALDLFIDEEEGIWHLSNDGMITWADFGGIIAERTGYKKHKLVSKPWSELQWEAQRPIYSVLESNKGIKLPSF